MTHIIHIEMQPTANRTGSAIIDLDAVVSVLIQKTNNEIDEVRAICERTEIRFDRIAGQTFYEKYMEYIRSKDDLKYYQEPFKPSNIQVADGAQLNLFGKNNG